MIKIAIVEDEQIYVDQLKEVIEKSSKRMQLNSCVEIFSNGVDIVHDYKADYDIIFLDIAMPNYNGIVAAKEIRELDNDVVIIFVTNLAQYAINGYEVSALDFIVKPVEYESFFPKFEKAVKKANQKAKKQIFLISDGNKYRVNVSDICYIEVQCHLLHYHLLDKTIVTRGVIDQQEKELAKYGFFRIYKSYLVNLAYVNEVKLSTIVVNGDELMVSRFRKKEFLAALTLYLGEKELQGSGK